MAADNDWLRFFATLALLLPIATLLAVVSAFMRKGKGFNRSSGNPIEVSDFSLHLDGDRWNGPVFLKHLLLEQARVVDRKQEKQLRFAWRTFGMHVPGFGLAPSFSSGWFKLKNGDRALVYIAGKAPVILIPTKKDYVLLLSVNSPEEFIADLQTRQRAETMRKQREVSPVPAIASSSHRR